MECGPLPVFVEMFGLAGAGKSTLARNAGGQLPLLTRDELSRRWASHSSIRKVGVAAKALLGPAVAPRAVELALTAPLRSNDSFLRLARLVAKNHWLKEVSAGRLLEEGLLQDLWSVLYSSGRYDPDPQLLSPLIRALYARSRPSIVYIELDPKLSCERILKRTHGRSRFDGLRHEELLARLMRAAPLAGRVARAAAAAGLPLTKLDGSAPLPDLVDQLGVVLRDVAESQAT